MMKYSLIEAMAGFHCSRAHTRDRSSGCWRHWRRYSDSGFAVITAGWESRVPMRLDGNDVFGAQRVGSWDQRPVLVLRTRAFKSKHSAMPPDAFTFERYFRSARNKTKRHTRSRCCWIVGDRDMADSRSSSDSPEFVHALSLSQAPPKFRAEQFSQQQ